MSGQENLVIGLDKTIVVSCSGHSYICGNYQCNNILTDFELMKLSQMKSGIKVRCRWAFCRYCRQVKNTQILRCTKCRNGFHTTNQRSNTASLCIGCKRDNHDFHLKKSMTYVREAIQEARQDKACRVCGKNSKHLVECSDECRTIWHSLIRRKNNKEMVKLIKSSRYCQECTGNINSNSDFRNIFCSHKCKLARNARIVRNRRHKELINNAKDNI